MFLLVRLLLFEVGPRPAETSSVPLQVLAGSDLSNGLIRNQLGDLMWAAAKFSSDLLDL